MTEIVLPAGTTKVSAAEIPGLIALAIHPRVVAGRVVSYLAKHVPSKEGKSGHDEPLTDAERAVLEGIWKGLPATAPGIPEADWPRYAMAFSSAKKKPKWTPVPVWRNDALNSDILRIDAEEAHRRALGIAISRGELIALNHAGLPVNMAYPDATITVGALRQYAAKFDVGVRVSARPLSAMTYHLPMFARLKPTSEWKGGRMSHTDLLKLSEAARMASKHSGEEISIDEFLRAASRGEILLFTDCHRSVTMMPCRASDEPLHIPAQSFPTLPLSACLALSQRGRAKWRTSEDYEQAPALPAVLCRFTRWQLPDNEPDLESTTEDCRVNGLYTHALADAFIEGTDEPSTDSEAASGAVQPPENEPLPLTTRDMAFAFAGLRYSEERWKKPLGDQPKWLKSCVAIPGRRAGVATHWNPVLIGGALVHAGHVTARSVRAKFQTLPLLKPWLDEWKTYEAEYVDDRAELTHGDHSILTHP